MGKSAYIYLVENSKQQELQLDDVKELISYYQEITSKTGEQLQWEYSKHSFPYTVEEQKDQNGHYLILRGQDDRYQYILIGVGSVVKQTKDGTNEQFYVQLMLPDNSEHGDLGKANELAKFLGKKLEGELHLFNGRIMYYYKRK
ncbi:DUF1885 family protein [Bacillaceae bacterium S4-13-58]